MIVRELLLTDELNGLYREGGDPDFAEILRHFQIEGDDRLADLIDADGRLRLRLKKPVPLERYLTAIPDLPSRSEPLDAAIDMALRALARTGRADEHAIDELVAEFPEIGAAIREAAALNNAVWSTAQIQKHLATPPFKELPTDFGPLLENGVCRYELRELLGEGAFGAVYLAVDRQLSEKDHPALVSIKVLPGDDRSQWTRQQLVDEARKARRINHPNVARVLDRGLGDQNEDFVVYEFVGGGDLGKWMRRHKNKLEVTHAVQLAAKVARGVHAAHMAGLVHCDLKPNNIVLTTEGEPKVTDFGIATRQEDRSDASAAKDWKSAPVGNLAFISPEQYRAEPGALTIPTDVYALGGILYWLLTRILPNGSTPEKIRRTHDPQKGRQEPPRVRGHRPEVDRDLEAICQRAMAIRPEDRFSSAADVAENLEAWLGHEPLTWTKPSMSRRTRLWVRRKPALAAAAAVIVGLVVVSAVILRHMTSVAAERRFEAALAEARLEEEERYRDKFRTNLRGFIAQLRESLEQGLAEELLPQIWVAEWLFGPTVLGKGPGRFELWKARVEVVRDLVKRAKAAGDGGDLSTLLWESALGFWLIKAGEHREAAGILAENLEEWQELLRQEDPWLMHLETMRVCALVGQLAEERGSGPLDRRPEELLVSASTLEQAEQGLDGDAPGSPLHCLVLEHLARLYEPGLLNRPQRAREIAETLRKLAE